MEELNRDQEMKFMTYMTAADDLIEHLRSENNRLCAEVSELRNEVTSIRYSKDNCTLSTKSFCRRRTISDFFQFLRTAFFPALLSPNEVITVQYAQGKELSEEIERLHCKETHSRSRDDRFDNGQNMPEGSPVASGGTSISIRRKRSRDSGHEKKVMATPYSSDQHEDARTGESVINLTNQPISNSSSLANIQPNCCRGRVDNSVYIAGPPCCMFQELVECLVDLKFSIVTPTDEILVSAVHESSGYSFSLQWMSSSQGGEAELLYRASSLGTFERVAPEWMRDVLMFSKRMCPIFFKRVSYIVKLHN